MKKTDRKTTPTRTVDVAVPEHPYQVFIGSGSRSRFSELFTRYGKGRALWVTDENVAAAWRPELDELSGESLAELVVLPPGEGEKTLFTVEKLSRICAQRGLERGDTLVACGGGVVGDIVGFTAACFKRGIAFIQVPTTLLAMVDASVGGKTGVDLPEGKNLVGAFHQPLFVLIDVDFLNTLPEREFRSGFTEVAKTALIGDPSLFEMLKGGVQDRFFRKDTEVLIDIIEACVRFKAAVVVQDEKESDHRRILNFGHTIGHALEVLGNYDQLKHGEAVLWGMWAAVNLSVSSGLLDAARGSEILQFLEPYMKALPVVNCSEKDILYFIERDKKVSGGVPHFVLVSDVGEPVISDQAGSGARLSPEDLEEVLSRMIRKMSE